MFFKPVPPVWRPGQVPDLDLFLSIGEVAELEAARWKTKSYAGFMSMFVELILKGAFDPQPLPYDLPFVERMKIDDSLRYLLVPQFVPPISRGAGLAPAPPQFVGYGCALAEDIPFYVANADHYLGGGPQRRTAQDFADYGNYLLTTKFDGLPRIPQCALNDIIIAKDKLKDWYDLKNMYVPWSEDPGGNACDVGPPLSPDAHCRTGVAPRGRPEKPAWAFIRRRAREMKRNNPKLLHKEIAGAVMEEAAKTFRPSDRPNASTVIKEMGRILDGV